MRAPWVALVLLAPSVALAQSSVPLREGWTHHPRIGTSGVEGVACGADRAYARSWSGTLALWDGRAWTTVGQDRERSRYGRTVAVASNGHAFVQSGELVSEWTGTAWIDHRVPDWLGDDDAQLATTHDGAVYVVGRGRLARFDGTRFATYDAGTWRSLTAVAVIDDLPWIGGQGGTILRHDGTRWARMDTGIDGWVTRLLAFGLRDVWALAQGPRREPMVIHYDGERWARRDPPGDTNAIGGTPDRVYVTGDYGLAVFREGGWHIELAPAELGAGYHAFQGVCATDRHYVVGLRSGGALVRPRP